MKTAEYYEQLVEQVKTLELTTDDSLPDDDAALTYGFEDRKALMKVIEKQRIYFWIRLYIKEDSERDVKIGDDINIIYKPSGEKLGTKFIAYGKKGLDKDHDEEVTQYVKEDDLNVLSLMIDIEMVNNNDDIPFIRTLFKTGNHYEYQLMKRNELVFINERTGDELDYFDCDF